MKKLWCLLGILFLLPAVLAINLDVEKISENEAMVLGLDEPAIFNINVTNNGATSDFTFYTFFGLGFDSSEKVRIEKDETKEVTLKIYPRDDFKIRGNTIFNYFIKDNFGKEMEEELTVNLVDLDEAFEVGSEIIDSESNLISIYIYNKVNFNFEDVSAKFSSVFFDSKEEFSLSPYEKKEFEIQLEKEEFNDLMAGFYTLSAEIETKGIVSETEGKIQFKERDDLEVTTKNYGFIIFTKVIKTENLGNTIGETDVSLSRNILSRLFTSMSPEPSSVYREGMTIHYVWKERVAPGEVYEVSFKTNWFLPFLAIAFVILIIYFTKKYSKNDLILRKKVSFVNAKGGEFALKVTVLVGAREHMENVRIIDRLPPLVRVYGRFGGEIPSRFYKSKKVFEWDFNTLEAGEKRVLSYIIYSKVGVLGRFALPSAKGVFKKEGKNRRVTSNRAYFLAQSKGKDSFE